MAEFIVSIDDKEDIADLDISDIVCALGYALHELGFEVSAYDVRYSTVLSEASSWLHERRDLPG